MIEWFANALRAGQGDRTMGGSQLWASHANSRRMGLPSFGPGGLNLVQSTASEETGGFESKLPIFLEVVINRGPAAQGRRTKTNTHGNSWAHFHPNSHAESRLSWLEHTCRQSSASLVDCNTVVSGSSEWEMKTSCRPLGLELHVWEKVFTPLVFWASELSRSPETDFQPTEAGSGCFAAVS